MRGAVRTTGGGEPESLAEIRGRIDEIDEAMHRLLIERSRVVDALIRIKGASGPAAAFRPGREAEMMRRLVLRHEGRLPLVTLEHIWREIITSFTALQAPFAIVTGPAAEPLAMRDLARFHFGFSVPMRSAASAAEAIAEVERSGMSIAVVAAATEGAWWEPLSEPGGPKAFARLPFVEADGRASPPAAYVVGPALADAAEPDMALLAVSSADDVEGAVEILAGAIVSRAGDEALVELPTAVSDDDLKAEAQARGGRIDAARRLGGFFAPIRVMADGGAES